MEIIEEGRLCVDCAMILANGEDSCEEACTHGTELAPGACLTFDPDNESEFYVPWRPCPGCGTTLAGTWFGYAVLGEPS